HRMLTRRQFLGRSALAVAGSAVLPPFLARAAMAAQQSGAAGRYGDDTILVVIQFTGGNDGLNTVVPYGIDGYYEARPNLAIKEDAVLPLTDQIGLHPTMGNIQQLYQQGQVAIIQGAGYANPILSHFRSMDIWQTAAPDSYETKGWLANYLASTSVDDGNPIFAASITGELVRALLGNGGSVPTIASMPAYQ